MEYCPEWCVEALGEATMFAIAELGIHLDFSREIECECGGVCHVGEMQVVMSNSEYIHEQEMGWACEHPCRSLQSRDQCPV